MRENIPKDLPLTQAREEFGRLDIDEIETVKNKGTVTASHKSKTLNENP